MTAESLSRTMRETWDALARRNAMHFIATERAEWEPADFLESGRETVDRLLRLCNHRPEGTALDLGCGAGRLTLPLAERFQYVIGVDVSEEMVQRARALANGMGRRNVTFRCNNGLDLSSVASGSCDLVFSYIVLQHVPSAAIVHGYVREFGRILKPGGHALFQVPVYRPGRCVASWRVVQAASRRALAPLERLGWVPPERGRAFRGSRVAAGDLDRSLALSGLTGVGRFWSASSYRFCDDAVVYARRI